MGLLELLDRIVGLSKSFLFCSGVGFFAVCGPAICRVFRVRSLARADL